MFQSKARQLQFITRSGEIDQIKKPNYMTCRSPRAHPSHRRNTVSGQTFCITLFVKGGGVVVYPKVGFMVLQPQLQLPKSKPRASLSLIDKKCKILYNLLLCCKRYLIRKKHLIPFVQFTSILTEGFTFWGMEEYEHTLVHQ